MAFTSKSENMSRSQAWWDNYYLNIAKSYAYASKDPSTKVGAVIIDDDRRIVAAGYNGLPKTIKDTPERLNNRDIKYKIIIHAECNAILHATSHLKGCTIFTWPFMPCSSCASMIIEKEIKRVVSLSNNNNRWLDNFSLSREILEEAGIEIKLYDKLIDLEQS